MNAAVSADALAAARIDATVEFRGTELPVPERSPARELDLA
ncbi:hypothetical protein [Cryobacterium sp. GrIS_2_6]|nr:hypothetical protein [Cryobacterium psychrotolerans]